MQNNFQAKTGEEPDRSKQQAHEQQESKSIQPEQKLPAGEATPAQGDLYKDLPNSQIRKIIAKRLLESKTTVPHYYVKATAELGAATAMRKSMKAQGTKVCSLASTTIGCSFSSSNDLSL